MVLEMSLMGMNFQALVSREHGQNTSQVICPARGFKLNFLTFGKFHICLPSIYDQGKLFERMLSSAVTIFSASSPPSEPA
jgi:hypothetical protein